MCFKHPPDKCNVDKCTVPVDIYHIPTIKIYPAKNKSSPLEYFDKTTEPDRYLRFIEEEGSSEADFAKAQLRKSRGKL